MRTDQLPRSGGVEFEGPAAFVISEFHARQEVGLGETWVSRRSGAPAAPAAVQRQVK